MIRPAVQTLHDLFGDRVQYTVPVYQRPYVWNEEEHWGPLWEDVREMTLRLERGASTNAAHFLGAIVIELRYDAPGRVREYTVIDGQQRLTTLQLLLAAFHRVASEHGHWSAAEVANLLRNTGHHARGDLQLKVWPGRYDRQGMRDALLPSPTPLESSSAISAAKTYFEQQIRDWVGSGAAGAAARFDVLHDTLDGLIQLVSIQLDGTADAQVVFETLNSRGADLTSLDLAKNALLHQAERDGLDVAALHDQHWEPSLGDAGYWLEQIRQGRYTRERSDLFLMHWLTMKLGAPPRGQHLFADFRNKVLRGEPTPRVADLIPELCRDARLFRSFDELEPTEPEGRFFRRLNQMDTTTLLPVALKLFRSPDLPEWGRLRALAALESWLVRRMLLGATTQHYNRLLGHLLARMSEEPAAAADEVIIRRLREFDSPTDRWPGDAEVRTRLESQPLYGWISQKRICMLLEACEYNFAGAAGAEMIPVPDGLTVEHALPQEWHQYWPVPLDAADPETAAQEREERVHRLGNLTLVTQKLNSSLSNAAWPTKRQALSTRSQLLVNQLLCANENWTEASIDARGADLASRIIATWPGPDNNAWSS